MKRQRGLGLVELMVGITIGLIVAAAASVVMVNQVTEHRRLMLNTQIQQDLRAASSLIVSDTRRSGFWAAPQTAVWSPGQSVSSNPYQVKGGCSLESDGQYLLVYAFSGSDYGITVSAKPNPQLANVKAAEYFGLRRSGDTLQFMFGCGSDGGPNWQPLTDPNVVAIKGFSYHAADQAVDLGDYCSKVCTEPNCPRLVVRRYDITLAGEATNDPRVKRELHISSRQRSDAIRGACPT